MRGSSRTGTLMLVCLLLVGCRFSLPPLQRGAVRSDELLYQELQMRYLSAQEATFKRSLIFNKDDMILALPKSGPVPFLRLNWWSSEHQAHVSCFFYQAPSAEQSGRLMIMEAPADHSCQKLVNERPRYQLSDILITDVRWSNQARKDQLMIEATIFDSIFQPDGRELEWTFPLYNWAPNPASTPRQLKKFSILQTGQTYFSGVRLLPMHVGPN